jgi:Zn-dependent peptidase ImmA (M78 family)/DNA-binding XRE family transcriptional regulator
MEVNIRARLGALRERSGMSQDQLAAALGIRDRQTLSQIELGERRITPDEMVRASEVFGVQIDYFTDPFELAGEGSFSWREAGLERAQIDEFEAKARKWIGLYRYLAKAKGEAINSSMRRVALNERSTFEEAYAEGEAIGKALKLPEPPALHLVDLIQTQLDTLVLYVDARDGLSGAACRLDQLNAILINRNEPVGRRAYDTAHELFHLLTWDKMTPRHVESENRKEMSRAEKRIELLADNFAAALLMPEEMVRRAAAVNPVPSEPAALAAWAMKYAADFGVSSTALKWRVVNLGLAKKQTATLAKCLNEDKNRVTPPRFSKRFMDVLAWGLEEGQLSARKAAGILQMTLDDLADLFSEHGLKAPFAL